jgi:L-asparaginase II
MSQDPHDHASHHHDHGPGHGAGCCGGQAAQAGTGPAAGAVGLPGDGAPLLVEVTRGGMVESRHRGIAAVVDAEGRVLRGWGDVERPVYARSAIKSLQAMPLIETGAFDARGLGDEELALACASHAGEPRHTGLVASWLERIGLSHADLECGSHLPYDEATAHELIRRGEAPTALHNNCSGKHAGMLTTALHRGEKPKGYVRHEHPVQQRILGVLEQMTGHDLSRAPRGVDGCGIPTIAVPLGGLAYAMARIADPSDLPDARAEAAARIRRAWGRHPYLIGGRDSFDTRFMQAAGSEVLLKIGAEGVMCAVLPGQGLGVAVKIDDGAARAVGVAMAGILRSLGVLPEEAWRDLDGLVRPEITNRAGLAVGSLRPAPGIGEGP